MKTPSKTPAAPSLSLLEPFAHALPTRLKSLPVQKMCLVSKTTDTPAETSVHCALLSSQGVGGISMYASPEVETPGKEERVWWYALLQPEGRRVGPIDVDPVQELLRPAPEPKVRPGFKLPRSSRVVWELSWDQAKPGDPQDWEAATAFQNLLADRLEHAGSGRVDDTSLLWLCAAGVYASSQADDARALEPLVSAVAQWARKAGLSEDWQTALSHPDWDQVGLAPLRAVALEQGLEASVPEAALAPSPLSKPRI